MSRESLFEIIKQEFQKRAEAIELSIAWCDQYGWVINRHRDRLEQELRSLLTDLQGLTEAEQVYGCHNSSDLEE
jgi:hypothetical protein